MTRDQTRRHILEVAGEVFSRKGFEKATVREICGQADVNVAGINYYFGGKERLYVEAVKHARLLREEDAPLPEWDDQTTPSEKLRQFILTMLRRLLGEHGDRWRTRLLMREIIEPTQACEELVREAFDPYFRILLGILREMLPEDVPEATLKQLGFSVVGQCVYYRAQDKVISMLVPDEEYAENFSVDQLADHIFRVSVAAAGAFSHDAQLPDEPAGTTVT